MKIKLKINLHKLFKILYILLFICFCLTLIFLGRFLYENFYRTLGGSERVLDLRKQVINEDINIKNFEDVITNIEKKTQSEETVIDLNF